MVTNYFYPSVGGLEIAARRLATRLILNMCSAKDANTTSYWIQDFLLRLEGTGRR